MIFLLLGSNLGDRAANLAAARKKLRERLGFESFGNCKLPQVHFSPEVRSEAVGFEAKESLQVYFSPEVKTEAVGFEGPFFLNQIVVFERLDIAPRKLLNVCKNIEIEMGRQEHRTEFDEKGGRIYRDRIIDIDILAFDDVRCNTKSLTLPHPQIWSRPFVREIAALLPEPIFKYFQTIVNN